MQKIANLIQVTYDKSNSYISFLFTNIIYTCCKISRYKLKAKNVKFINVIAVKLLSWVVIRECVQCEN